MAYLTNAEYVQRYGARESTLITNETANSNTPDTAKIDAALQDASDRVDSYIGARYATPLTDVPRVVMGFVAKLARQDLYTLNAPPEVKEQADDAISQLKDIAKGIASLPIEEGQTPPGPAANNQGEAATSGDGWNGGALNPCTLDGYLAPFLGTRRGRNWSQG